MDIIREHGEGNIKVKNKFSIIICTYSDIINVMQSENSYKNLENKFLKNSEFKLFRSKI